MNEKDRILPPKKRLNIPIGEVDIDLEYDLETAADFELPFNYIRSSRKLGTEGDVTLDCNVDQQDKVCVSAALLPGTII